MAHQWGDDVVEGDGWVLVISRLSFKECYGVVGHRSNGKCMFIAALLHLSADCTV